MREVGKKAAVCNYCKRFIAQEEIKKDEMVFVDWSIITLCKECEKHGRTGEFR